MDLYITWNPNPEIFQLLGVTIRWYSAFWLIALVSGAYVIYRQFKDQKLNIDDFHSLCIYSFLGIFIGARLGHCLFYAPDYYLANPLEAILPIQILEDGSWKFTGYLGLASHGGTIGLLVAIFLFARKKKIKYMILLDMMGIAAPVSAGFIRLANLMNSEIIGNPTHVPWAFIFPQVDALPRHPAQLYEALAYFCIFLIMIYFYWKKRESFSKGFFFGLCITLIFTFRFFIEFLKERQVNFEEGMWLDMGQILSIPFVLLGIYFVWRGTKKPAVQ